MPRVLMTADAAGGVWTYAVTLARELARLGLHVGLATMGVPLSADQRQDALQVGADLFEGRAKLEWMDEPWDDVRSAGEWLLDVERRFRPDVVQLNGYVHGALPWKAPVVMVGHSCVLSWWRAVRGEEAPAEWDRYREAVTRGLRAAGLVIAPSAAMLRSLQNDYGPLPCGRVIPNAAVETQFLPVAKEPFVFSAGRLWDQAKNIAALDRVAAALEWPVYVAGDPKGLNGAERTMSHAVALGRVPHSDVARWLGRASIYALPARYEPFGLSVLEAALAGCALVLGNIESLRENWCDAALFVDPDDCAGLLAALQLLIHDIGRRHELARRARVRALELTPARMADAYMAAYREALTTHDSTTGRKVVV